MQPGYAWPLRSASRSQPCSTERIRSRECFGPKLDAVLRWSKRPRLGWLDGLFVILGAIAVLMVVAGDTMGRIIGTMLVVVLVGSMIIRLRPPTDKRGWLLLWGSLSALLMFGSLGPWLRGFGRLADHGGLQRGDGWLVLVAAVAGAVALVGWRQRRAAGFVALFAGLTGLGTTLYAATHLMGLIPPKTQFLGSVNLLTDIPLYPRDKPKALLPSPSVSWVGWGLGLALLASLSLALCGLVWFLAVSDLDRGRSVGEPDAATGLAELH